MRPIVLLVLFGALAACSNGAASPPAAVLIRVSGSSKLQLGVGTATINTDSGSFVGTNFTMTFRGSDGNNATGVNTPTLSGPPGFAIGFPGSVNALHGLAQLAFSSDVQGAQQKGVPIVASDFQESLGPYTGVFGYGMAKDNLVSSQLTASLLAAGFGGNGPCSDLTTANLVGGTAGSPIGVGNQEEASPLTGATGNGHVYEMGLPLGSDNENDPALGCARAASAGFDAQISNGSSVFPINYYGGPPAWPSPQGYGAPAFFTGFGLGFTDTPATPVAGTYTLDVAYPSSADYSTSAHVLTTTQLRTIVPLPVIAKPTLVVNSDGSGIVTTTVPAGLLEAIVEIRTPDCRNFSTGTPGGSPANNYSQVLHASGPQQVFFAANLGPPDASGAPSRTFCALNTTATVSVLGFDYAAYESSYPFDMSVAPKITNGDGHTGQADVTTSPPLIYVQPGTTAADHRRKSND